MTGFQIPQEEVAILWSAKKKLTWKDFKGTPPVNERVAAVTASGITYQFSSSGTGGRMEIDFTVSSHFYPNKSWYQPKLCDSVILGHEQLHFDISELYARKMHNRMRETTFTENVKAEVRSIYQEILEELKAFQYLYDEETNFSRNLEQQLLWNKKIKEALNR